MEIWLKQIKERIIVEETVSRKRSRWGFCSITGRLMMVLRKYIWSVRIRTARPNQALLIIVISLGCLARYISIPDRIHQKHFLYDGKPVDRLREAFFLHVWVRNPTNILNPLSLYIKSTR